MNWLGAVLVIFTVAILMIYLASAVYTAYQAAGIQPYLLSKLESTFLSVVGPWLPWIFALLIVAALWYTYKKET
jgi:uncharacterized membrane protein YkgB